MMSMLLRELSRFMILFALMYGSYHFGFSRGEQAMLDRGEANLEFNMVDPVEHDTGYLMDVDPPPQGEHAPAKSGNRVR